MSSKTEQPTPRRLRKARDEGDSGASSNAAQSVAFVAAVALAPAAIGALAGQASAALRGALAACSRGPGAAADEALRFDGTALALDVLRLLAPVLLATGIAGGVAHAIQTGGVFATSRLAPRLDRIDPIAGLRRLVSGERLFALARSLFAAGVVGWLACRGLERRMGDVARVAGRARWTGAVVDDIAARLVWQVAAFGLALGLVDRLVTRRAWMGRLRMTKEEVRREHRESEGDPAIRAARHRAHQEILAQSAVAAVRTASVVVVNPTHLACALRYDAGEGDDAPVVVATGEGDLAARIAQEARHWAIPVVRDVPLARALVELSVGDAIPEALYEAVAEVLREIASS